MLNQALENWSVGHVCLTQVHTVQRDTEDSLFHSLMLVLAYGCVVVVFAV